MRAAAIALAAAAVGQVPLPVPAAEVDAAIARYDELGLRAKAGILRRIELELARTPDPALRRIRALAAGVAPLDPEPVPSHDPRRWAAGVAPGRTVLAADAAAVRAVRARYPPVRILPDLPRTVGYDWRTARITAIDGAGYTERFAALARGYAPGTDAAVARLLAELDDDPAQRPAAAWFGHLYADLDARVHPGVTLYDVWYSGEIADVPDVDAIAFAVTVLGETHHRSPLSGPPRARLYQQIADGALSYRKYRTLREAAAGAFVAAEPVMDPLYQRLVPRLHYLWGREDGAIPPVAAALAAAGRETLLEELDHTLTGDGAAAARDRFEGEVRSMQRLVQRRALAVLDEVAPAKR